MSLLRCGDCTTEYAVDLTSCPHCGSGQAEPIGGPSYLNPAPDPAPRPPRQPAAGKSASPSAKPPAG